ncbi:type IV secretion system protein [Luteimonas sp. BDR2-5]|uniref:type IV secretion system protein n=1 Tax=Proluteimonas luteida TaxID=2878685 RepID=UPI001E2A4395|nr:type IV secretion system protein [Luteimonas sp. BDR2-5]MCD9030014.1 type IV secretion system protein [Luteimonas sp. BDR2-5]
MSFDPSGFVSWAFFAFIFDVVNGSIESFQEALLGRTTRFISGIVFTLLVFWVLIQGFMVVTGRSRESLMGLVVGSLRAFLIVIAATSMSFFGNNLTTLMTTDMPQAIHQVISGEDGDVEEAIDDNLTTMGLIFALVDALPSDENESNSAAQRNITTMTGIGIAGPSVIGGAMLLLYKIALVLFVGFGPIFILALLFKQTQDLFKRWLLYGIGTMFAMGVLAVMVSIATEVVAISATAMVAAYTLSSMGVSEMPGFGGGLNSAAVQQGGVGLIMSVLMVMAPPMAAMFFNGTLGQFAANSSFGNVGRNSSGQTSDFKQDYVGSGQKPEPGTVVAPPRR